MELSADSARPLRVSGSARTDSRRAESVRNPIASHVNFGDDSALSSFTRTQWTAAFTVTQRARVKCVVIDKPSDARLRNYASVTEQDVRKRLMCHLPVFLQDHNR